MVPMQAVAKSWLTSARRSRIGARLPNVRRTESFGPQASIPDADGLSVPGRRRGSSGSVVGLQTPGLDAAIAPYLTCNLFHLNILSDY